MIKEIYERVGLSATLEEEEWKFYNRLNLVFQRIDDELRHADHVEDLFWDLNFELGGEEKSYFRAFLDPHSFLENLVVTGVLLILLKKYFPDTHTFLNSKIKEAIDNSLVDLGIIFENEMFIKRGAETLDRAAVLDPLDWLEDYKTTKELFEGALTEYLRKDYEDSITKAYSPLESLVKTVLDSNKKSLDNLIPSLLPLLNLPVQWNAILKHFCDYAHEFSSRHGKKDEDINDEIDPKDAEAYMYFTGLMIRLIIQTIKTSENLTNTR